MSATKINSMESEVVVKAVLVNEQEEILVLRRSQTDPIRPGGPDFPGGGQDIGEDVMQTATREIQEEVGMKVDPSELRIVHLHMSTEEQKTVFRILCAARVETPSITLSFEHDLYQWLDISAAENAFENRGWGIALHFAIERNLLP